MNAISRRHALRNVAGLAGVALLTQAGSCQVTTVSAAATDANLIAAGVASVIATLQTQPIVTASQQATLTQMQGYLATIQADAAALAKTPSTSTAQEIVTVVQTLAPLALSFVPGGSTVAVLVNAALSLAPQLLADLGVAGATMGAAPVKYSADEARLILKGAAK